MIGLTRQQAKLLSFIAWSTKSHGYPPSIEEMTTALGLAGKSTVIRMCDALEDRGYIRRVRGHARALDIIHVPAKLPDWRHSPGIIREDRAGRLIENARMRFIDLRDIRPLNLKQMEKAA